MPVRFGIGPRQRQAGLGPLHSWRRAVSVDVYRRGQWVRSPNELRRVFGDVRFMAGDASMSGLESPVGQLEKSATECYYAKCVSCVRRWTDSPVTSLD